MEALVEDLDAAGVLAAAADAHASVLAGEASLLALGAHWLDLHALPRRNDRTPGSERARRSGAEGTPWVGEFAAAEFGAVAAMGYLAAATFLRDVANLRHRHPLLWAAASDPSSGVRVWQARQVARMVAAADLDLTQARWVDRQTTGYIAGLPWSRVLTLVEAKIIEADPGAAEQRRLAAAMERFVRTGQSNEYGLKTLVARAEAGEVVFFVAMVDRIAAVLADQGDTDPVDVRRSKAIGILATPARALALLTTTHPEPDPAPDPGPEPDRRERRCPVCAGSGHVSGHVAAFATGLARLDPARLLPKATVYLHLGVQPDTGEVHPVARFEGVGPITATAAADLLHNCQVTVKPVIDLAGQVPVEAYETPDRLREALWLRHPTEVFPYGTHPSRGTDVDHTMPYRTQPDLETGRRPAQTHSGNLGPLSRFPHRLKTHGGWHCTQLRPGVYDWHSPHGYHYRVDHTGTHPLGRVSRAETAFRRLLADRPRQPQGP